LPEHPLAYFITIRTYGTWLSGDPRGSVDDEHSAYGEPFARRDDFRHNYQARRLRAQPLTLGERERRTVEAVVEELCQFRSWTLLAVNVRTNHVHLVITSPDTAERVLGDTKAYATRGLRRNGLVGPEQRVWARHGSTVYLWSDEETERCIAYVQDFQGADLPGSEWPRQHRERSS
jgi:REP element-mobilizing transposase RayT